MKKKKGWKSLRKGKGIKCQSNTDLERNACNLIIFEILLIEKSLNNSLAKKRAIAGIEPGSSWYLRLWRLSVNSLRYKDNRNGLVDLWTNSNDINITAFWPLVSKQRNLQSFTGFEYVTSWTPGRYCVQMSYGEIHIWLASIIKFTHSVFL